METLTVWRFDSEAGAELAAGTLDRLVGQGQIRVHDAATVTWPKGKRKPRTRQQHDLTGAGALSGAFWGMLFGLIFFVPLLGAAVGAAAGALTRMMTDAGIDDEFIERVREQVTPGTSALFLLSSDAVLDRVRDAFAGQHPRLVETNLSTEQEERLRATFGED